MSYEDPVSFYFGNPFFRCDELLDDPVPVPDPRSGLIKVPDVKILDKFGVYVQLYISRIPVSDQLLTSLDQSVTIFDSTVMDTSGVPFFVPLRLPAYDEFGAPVFDRFGDPVFVCFEVRAYDPMSASDWELVAKMLESP